MNLLCLPDDVFKALDTFCVVEDFFGLDAPWNTTLDTDSAAAEDADGLNGVVTVLSDGDDNDEAYLYTNELFKFASGKPFLAICRAQYAEASTDDANILIGIGEGFGAANTLQDNGAGPPADYDGVCLYKVDGGTRWNFETSVGTTQLTTALDLSAGGSSYFTAALLCNPISSTEFEAWPLFDAAGGLNLQPVYEYETNTGKQAKLGHVKHRQAYSSVGEMAFCIGVKSGGAAEESINVDLVALAAKR